MPTAPRRRHFAVLFCAAALWLALMPVALLAQAQPDTRSEPAVPLDRRFTYQGRLDNGDEPVTGSCDLRFILYNADAGGSQVGNTQTVENVTLAAGIFVVTLNDGNQFGNSAFNGEQRWLEVTVRCPAGDGQFVILSPRQPLNATPNAAFALHAATATNATSATNAQSVPWSGVTGVPDAVLNPPTYSAGAGLQLNASGQFRVAFAGSGSANTVARSNHDHFGQHWSGSIRGAGLMITNTAEYDGQGIVGWATATSDVTYGVVGRSDSPAGRGVFGYATDINGPTASYGVYGITESRYGSGVEGYAVNESGNGVGVYGVSLALTGRGVAGMALGTNGTTYGVWGRNYSNSGAGVAGMAWATTGTAYGVAGSSESTSGTGVHGMAWATTGTTYGVYGETRSPNGRGVVGLATSNTGGTYGVVGISNSSTGRGVYGIANSSSGQNFGVYGQTSSASGYGGYFVGRLSATGTKTFRIDHPLDPANKILNHAAIESSEQLDLYSGNVILDGSGSAEVILPAWFSALNTDFRYQLTAIGATAPGLYIAAKIQDNRFRIGGGAPGLEVSWLITSVRHDPTALHYPLVVEEEKPEAERGTYLTPAAFGQPVERGTHYQDFRVDELLRESAEQQERLREESTLDAPPPVD